MTPTTGTDAHRAEIDIDAPRGRAYDLLADVTRMGEWSPECVRCRWIGAPRRPEVGARFRGTSRNGRRRWSTVSTVSAATPGRTFAFDVTYFRLPVAGWRYEFSANDSGGTHVTESVEDRRGRLIRALSPLITGSPDRGRRNDETMQATLIRLKAAAEQPNPLTDPPPG